MTHQAQVAVVIAVQSAESGVDYTPRYGATCPWCGQKRIPVYKTMPWSDGFRIRYHHCSNPECLLHGLGTTVKSLQEE